MSEVAQWSYIKQNGLYVSHSQYIVIKRRLLLTTKLSWPEVSFSNMQQHLSSQQCNMSLCLTLTSNPRLLYLLRRHLQFATYYHLS